ncbi:hypothetical protein N0V88_004735 [Collariella sp. IMI 366227]|nr:hypothetical protein N0V88_004735 [Collariella sp. IMI 366227]
MDSTLDQWPPQLTGIAQNGSLDPHPVSGEIEVDWDNDVDIEFKKVDEETLQAMVVLKEQSLFFKLVYCTGDAEGGGDGWRVGEVGIADSSLGSFGGFSTIDEADKSFKMTQATSTQHLSVNGYNTTGNTNSTWKPQAAHEEDEDDDDVYWARYDATPSRTPAANPSPAPRSVVQTQTSQPGIPRNTSTEAEDAYFAQYDSVQPAMDNHDPDEEAHLAEHAEHFQPLPPLGLAKPEPTLPNEETASQSKPTDTQPLGSSRSSHSSSREEKAWELVHPPRPSSSASSNGPHTVAKLEEVAQGRQQTEFGVKQHISRSIRSLFLLSRASGIDREEFERMVHTELDVLGMLEHEV